jgi:hypothetical protein
LAVIRRLTFQPLQNRNNVGAHGSISRCQVQRLAEKCALAEHNEWNRKGATLIDVTARKEYGVSRDFIVQGIRAGNLQYCEVSVWGNPYLRVLRSQLERYIVEQLGSKYLVGKTGPTCSVVNVGIRAFFGRATAVELTVKRQSLASTMTLSIPIFVRAPLSRR